MSPLSASHPKTVGLLYGFDFRTSLFQSSYDIVFQTVAILVLVFYWLASSLL